MKEWLVWIVVVAAIGGLMYLLYDFMKAGWGSDDEKK